MSLPEDLPAPPGAVTETVAGADGAPRQRVRFGNLWVDALTFEGAIDEIDKLVAEGNGGSIFTPNVDHVVNVEKNPAFRAAYEAARLSLVDGQPLVWASRLLGVPLPDKISGSDLLLPLMRRAAHKRWRVYLLGGMPGVAEKAGSILREQHGVEIVGVDAPMITFTETPSEEEAVVDRVIAARPDLVLVAMGSPKQEVWMHRAEAWLRPAVSIGIGASLDFIAGTVKRAPRWMSKNGLEWLFRLAQEPRRLARRYLVNDPKFLFVLTRTLMDPPGERKQLDER